MMRTLRSPATWHVYKLINSEGVVLYIGSCQNPRARLRQHERGAAWWPEVAQTWVSAPISTRRAALDHERKMIERLDPPYNVFYTSRDPRSRKRTEVAS